MFVADGCDSCYLRNIEGDLEYHFSDVIAGGAKPEEVVFILNQEGQKFTDALPSISFLNDKFPGVDIKFDEDFEGMERKGLTKLFTYLNLNLN